MLYIKFCYYSWRTVSIYWRGVITDAIVKIVKTMRERSLCFFPWAKNSCQVQI
jgi:hypothetical protein